jgi:hypothetical protein
MHDFINGKRARSLVGFVSIGLNDVYCRIRLNAEQSRKEDFNK